MFTILHGDLCYRIARKFRGVKFDCYLFQVLMLTDIGLNQVIEDGLKYNLRSAALCGVLLQENEIFTLEELFTTIASLSYHGEHSASLIRLI